MSERKVKKKGGGRGSEKRRLRVKGKEREGEKKKEMGRREGRKVFFIMRGQKRQTPE